MRTSIVATLAILAIDRIARMVAYSLPDPAAFVRQSGSVFYGFVYSLHDGFLYNVEAPGLAIVFPLVGLGLLVSMAIKPLWADLPLRTARLGAGLVLVGTISQAADFIMYGGAIDYLLFTVWYDGVVFNVADMMMPVGVLIIAISAVKVLAKPVKRMETA